MILFVIWPSWNSIVLGDLPKMIKKYENTWNIGGRWFKNAHNFLNIEDSQENPYDQKWTHGSKEAIEEPNGALWLLCAMISMYA